MLPFVCKATSEMCPPQPSVNPINLKISNITSCILCSIVFLQVNFMSAQMMAAASKDIEITGESLDEMKLLEDEARKMVDEAKKDDGPKMMKFVK